MEKIESNQNHTNKITKKWNQFLKIIREELSVFQFCQFWCIFFFSFQSYLFDIEHEQVLHKKERKEDKNGWYLVKIVVQFVFGLAYNSYEN